MKRVFSLILALAMTCTLAVSANAATVRTDRVPLRNTLAHFSTVCDKFTDVSATYWGRANIAYVVDRGLFNGTSETTFSPEATMSRAMLCTVLHRYAGSPAISRSSTYADVKAGTWYSDAVAWAQQNKILPYWRLNVTKISPDAGVERGEFAVMLRNFYEYCGGNKFNDGMAGLALIYTDMPTGSYAGTINPALSWAYTYSILNGTSGSTMSPNTQITRAQMAAILERFDRQFMEDGKFKDAESVGSETTPMQFVVNDAEQNDELIRLINDYRAENGLPRLAKNDKLMEAAAIRAEEAAFKFSHTRPDGRIGSTVLSDMGVTTVSYDWENLCGGIGAMNAFNAWKNSPGHNATMLTPDPVTDIGVGSYTDGNGHSAYVMVFGELYS